MRALASTSSRSLFGITSSSGYQQTTHTTRQNQHLHHNDLKNSVDGAGAHTGIPRLHMKPGYAPYDQGIAQGVFIRGMTGQPYIGQACTADPIPSKPVLQVQACELDVS